MVAVNTRNYGIIIGCQWVKQTYSVTVLKLNNWLSVSCLCQFSLIKHVIHYTVVTCSYMLVIIKLKKSLHFHYISLLLPLPPKFGLITGALGICCIVIGYLFPFLLLAYIIGEHITQYQHMLPHYVIVMSILLWPPVVYYDLITTTLDIVQSHSPWLVERATRMYKSIRAFGKII